MKKSIALVFALNGTFGGTFHGNLATATNLPGSSVVGAVPLATYAALATNRSYALNVELYSNNTAMILGQTYYFPDSTSAGIEEIQAMFPTNVPQGYAISITFGDQQDCKFTAPFTINHSIDFNGPGRLGGGLDYVGPTNLWAVTDVATNPLDCLIYIAVNPNTTSTSSIPSVVDVSFKNSYIRVATNFPCRVVGGTAFNFVRQNHAIIGPDVLTFANGNNYNTEWPIESPKVKFCPAIIGCTVWVYTSELLEDISDSELAFGTEVPGNCYLKTCGHDLLWTIGKWVSANSTVYTNCIFGTGCGIAIDGTLYYADISGLMPYEVHLPFLFAPATFTEAHIHDYSVQNCDYALAVNCNAANASYGKLMIDRWDENWHTNLFMVTTNDSLGNFYIIPTEAGANSPQRIVLGNIYNYTDPYTGIQYLDAEVNGFSAVSGVTMNNTVFYAAGQPYAETFNSTNASFSFSVNPDGSTNVTITITNIPYSQVSGAPAIRTAAYSNSTAFLASSGGSPYNGALITNLTGAGIAAQIKSSFVTNYSVGTGDTVLFCSGTNQLITLSGVSNVVGKYISVYPVTATATVILTNGVGTVMGASYQIVTNGQHATVISDGDNWR